MAVTQGEAFFLLDNHQFDLIVSDIRLPDGDGFAIKIDLERRGIKLPTVFLTSYLPQDAALLARRLGAAALITKPVLGKELIALIEKIMKDDQVSTGSEGQNR